jgi:hypothetical protein
LCAAAGLVDLSVLALDATKMGADAALDKNRSAAWITEQIQALLKATAERERTDTPPAEIPLPGVQAIEELASPKGRSGRLKAALAVIEAEEADAAAERRQKAAAAATQAEAGRKLPGRKPKDPAAALARAQADHAAALTRAHAKGAEREAKLAAAHANGKSLRGPQPGPDRDLHKAEQALAGAQAAAQAAPAEVRRANITDPDSRIMKTQRGWIQGYNAQAIVNANQIVLAHDVTQDANDVELYQPMISTLADTLTTAGVTATAADITAAVELMLADAGYGARTTPPAQAPTG